MSQYSSDYDPKKVAITALHQAAIVLVNLAKDKDDFATLKAVMEVVLVKAAPQQAVQPTKLWAVGNTQ